MWNVQAGQLFLQDLLGACALVCGLWCWYYVCCLSVPNGKYIHFGYNIKSNKLEHKIQ